VVGLDAVLLDIIAGTQESDAWKRTYASSNRIIALYVNPS
jgi:hypothetical protein